MLFSGKAFAYPENVTHGYSNCQTCHISPTGGGLVNRYGRVTSEAFMSTWSYPGQAQALWGALELPEQIEVGGDVRQVQYKVDQGDTQIQRNFMMQAEFELSLSPFKDFYFVTSGGAYGENKTWERRRYYIMMDHQTEEGISSNLRVGRFFPNYGVFLDDHTRVSRRGLGFDQGQETFNIEGQVSNSWGQLTVARVMGNHPAFADDGTGSINHTPNGNDGYTMKATYYQSKTKQYSFSFMNLKNGDNRRLAAGLSGLVGFTKKLYMIGQYDHVIDSPDTTNTEIIFTRLGYFLFQGFQLRADAQLMKSKNLDYKTYGAGVQWLPIPHFEFSAYYDRLSQNGVDGSEYVITSHYYL